LKRANSRGGFGSHFFFTEILMKSQRLISTALLSAVVALPVGSLAAQGAGNGELGVFGQFTRTDGAWQTKNGFGIGGRLGYFVTRRWELEGDFATSSFDNRPSRGSGSSSNQTFTGQINYGIPFGMGGRTHQFLLEAGAGGERFAGHSDFTVPLGGGFRFMLSDAIALRLDGIVEYVENPTAATFGFPPVVGVNERAARSTNVEMRAGLSWIIGNSKPAPAPPPPAPAPAPRQEAPQPRRQPPPPPPAAPDRSGIIRDSIAAVDRARASLQAKILFDFDRSEIRADQQAILDSKLPILRANPNVRIRIEGNADERGSDEYNMALGQRRAQIARKYLTDHGIDAARIDIASYGEERPVCQEHAESCWSQNRRDEFVIVAGGDNLIAPR
jgi:peptidoglycan-associated lipoprotein